MKEEYFNKGWNFEKEQKDSIVMRKNKKISEQLEDDVWILFKKMGFSELNKDNHLFIKTGSTTKQIDVFAEDEHNVFIVFCTSQENKAPPSEPLKPKIREISDLKDDISFSINHHYNKKMRVIYIFMTKNIIWDETDKQLAKEKEIISWQEEDLEAYSALVEQLGICAKYQMYSVLFGDKEAFEVGDIKVPALRGGMGKGKYYCFVIQPERLFPIAYVHRREKTNASEVKDTYQRMVSKNRLDKINDFVGGGGNFCNNIIMSFKKTKKRAKFEPNPKVEEIGGISYGILHFPPYYGCAWVIDGQHRLYGYSKSEKAKEHTIPVIIFEELSIMEQANLFVNINKEQAPVTTSLLWDLYPDIYEQSENKEHQILKTVSLVAKTLNSDKESIFYNRIMIPSLVTHDKKTINLTLTNLCDAIRDNRLIEEEGILFNEDYNKTISYASKRINAFFEVINEALPGDWEKGEKGLIRTNVGLRIFFIIFRVLLKYLNHRGEKSIYTKNDLSDFKNETKTILDPVFLKIKSMDIQKINDLRSASNKSMVVKNSQMLLWDLYDSYQFGAELWKDGRGWSPPIPNEESDENVENMVKETGIKLKNFIIKKLNSFHKEKWWEIGIPEGVKQNIIKNMENALSNAAAYKRPEVLAYPYEKKFFLYSSTSDLKEIIRYPINWKQLAHLFGDVEYISSMLKSLENIRNAFIGHEERKEEVDEIQKNLGYWGTKWIRRCIGLDPQKKGGLYLV